jgi:DNA-binding CsgD family transcriptional regulator
VRFRRRRTKDRELEQALRRSPAELAEWFETGRIRPGGSPTGDQGKIAKRISKLRVRDRYVLELMAEGRTDEEIARTMWISRATVASHRRQLIKLLREERKTDWLRR